MGSPFRAAGTVATGTTSLAVPYPTGVALGEKLYLQIVNKYPTNGPATPAGWTAPANNQATGGQGSAGADSGSVYVTVFSKVADAADVTASGAAGTVAVTVASANSSAGQMFAYTLNTPTATWDEACAIGADNTAGGTWVVAAGSDPGLSAGDRLITFSGANTDVGAMNAHAFTATGVTFAGATSVTADQGERADSVTGTGDDVSIWMRDAMVRIGPSSGAPSYTATRSGPAGNQPAGATVFVRLREVGGTDGPDAWVVPAGGYDFESRGELAFSHIWPCSDASGNAITAASSIDATQAMGAVGSGLYQQTVAGWTRKALGGTDGASITWRRGSGAPLDLTATSFVLVAIMAHPSAPAAARPIMALVGSASDTTVPLGLFLMPDGTLRLDMLGVSTGGEYDYTDGLAHWYCLYYDRTNGRVGVQTDKELITGAYSPSVTAANKGIGYVTATAQASAEFRCLWLGATTGAGAERDWAAFLENMGVALPAPPVPVDYTTWEAIRENMVGLLEALTPAVHARQPFRAHVDAGDFMEWVEKVPAASLRRFQLLSNVDYDIAETSGEYIDANGALVTLRSYRHTFDLRVAYPLELGLYGAQNERSLEDLVAADLAQIDAAIGRHGWLGYVSGHEVCERESVELIETPGARVLSVTFRVQYDRAAA